MDLTNVHDHPAVILNKVADAMTRVDSHSAAKTAHYQAANALRRYEETAKVTFAALDNDALDELRAAQAEADHLVVHDIQYVGCGRLLDAISKLLGEVEA